MRLEWALIGASAAIVLSLVIYVALPSESKPTQAHASEPQPTGASKKHNKPRLDFGPTPAKAITSPEPGTPEWVIYQAIAAALEEDTDRGYARVKPLLHSEITGDKLAEEHYRTLVFEAFHRKAKLFASDDVSGAFRLDYADENEKPGEIIKLFVVNERSDMPTPCRLKRDPNDNNEWRISKQCSL